MITPEPMRLGFFASYRKHIFLGLGMGAACAAAICAALFFTSGVAVTGLRLSGNALLGSGALMQATVRGTGLLPVKYHAVLLADGKAAAFQDVTVKPGAEQSVDIRVTGLPLGAHAVEMGGVKTDIKVLKPAVFTVKSLDVQPKDVKPGGDITVTAVIGNHGDVKDADQDIIVFDQDGQYFPFSIEVDPGGEQTVRCVFKNIQRGTHGVILAGQTTVISALAPANIQIKSLWFSNDTIKTTDAVTATVALENSGDVDGTYHLKVLANGAVYNEQDVPVRANGTANIALGVAMNQPGNYTFQAGTAIKTLHVLNITRPGNGTFLVHSLKGGKNRITLTNSASTDIIVVLAKTSDPGTAGLSVYLRAGGKTTVKGIPNGDYYLYTARGSDFDAGTQKFQTGARYSKDESPYAFHPPSGKYAVCTVTLFTSNGNSALQNVGQDSFPK